ncbi:MAG: asparaginase [Chloroflexi bacterium]|nr:asparaginase [Chloroflexota bacterium]
MPHQSLIEIHRGNLVDVVHRGSFAVADFDGSLVASAGDPELRTWTRSSLKPLQALPLVESGAYAALRLTPRELAVVCASHAGEPDHLAAVQSILRKARVPEEMLSCGVHPPLSEAAAKSLLLAGQKPTSLHANCSGKHAGMLALAAYLNLPLETYRFPDHPVQKAIRRILSRFTGLPEDDLAMEVDGCGVPNYALPLHSMAMAVARLCDATIFESWREEACYEIVNAMTIFPEMVGGTGRFDTVLMRVANRRLVSKGGAEGYQIIGLLPGARGRGSPALGIAMKIEDGDGGNRARPRIVIEMLRRLGVLSEQEIAALYPFNEMQVYNLHREVAGYCQSVFDITI